MSSFDLRGYHSQVVYGPTEFTEAKTGFEIIAATTDHEIVIDQLEFSQDEAGSLKLLGGATQKSITYHLAASTGGLVVVKDCNIRLGKGVACNLTTTLGATPYNMSLRILYHLVKHT